MQTQAVCELGGREAEIRLFGEGWCKRPSVDSASRCTLRVSLLRGKEDGTWDESVLKQTEIEGKIQQNIPTLSSSRSLSTVQQNGFWLIYRHAEVQREVAVAWYKKDPYSEIAGMWPWRLSSDSSVLKMLILLVPKDLGSFFK